MWQATPMERFARRRRLIRSGLVSLMLASALAVAGCGATTSPSSAQSGSSVGQPGGPGGGMAVRPCPGPYASVAQAGTPALVLTDAAPSGGVHVGDLVQVRLPSTQHWTFDNHPGPLDLVQPAGAQDAQMNVCFWTFRARTTGSVTLYFTGTQPCEGPGTACSTATVPKSFTVSVR